MSRRRTIALVATAAAGAAAVAATRAVRTWERAHDPTAGQPLSLPDGHDVQVPTPDGGLLHATVAGPDDARTFVLAHCWTGDRRVWGPVAKLLVDRGNRVVLYDHRGHGASTAGSHGLSIDALANDLRAVLEHLDLRNVTLGGHSMGGMCAQAFAVQHPESFAERVEAMVLVATACEAVGVGRFADKLAGRALANTRFDRVLAHPRIGPTFVRGSVGRRPALSHLQATAETFVATAAEARTSFFTSMREMDLTAGLPSINVPVTVVGGTHDRLLPPRYARRIGELIPDARLVMCEDAGHMLPWEEPEQLAELFVKAVEPVPERRSA